ncbi:protein starmaker-like [Brachypodium distachyon]|uniref:protein starmaker-like n=1 Tax=Brachypodium distachyon TaxID=15368 RepID=UPI000D0DC296|nr:protein starmaker-like [Brachypodium distachyon]|eukprot:XP_024316538.1 protein starmaker-like [Brachypodium distachyon]
MVPRVLFVLLMYYTCKVVLNIMDNIKEKVRARIKDASKIQAPKSRGSPTKTKTKTKTKKSTEVKRKGCPLDADKSLPSLVLDAEINGQKERKTLLITVKVQGCITEASEIGAKSIQTESKAHGSPTKTKPKKSTEVKPKGCPLDEDKSLSSVVPDNEVAELKDVHSKSKRKESTLKDSPTKGKPKGIPKTKPKGSPKIKPKCSPTKDKPKYDLSNSKAMESPHKYRAAGAGSLKKFKPSGSPSKVKPSGSPPMADPMSGSSEFKETDRPSKSKRTTSAVITDLAQSAEEKVKLATDSAEDRVKLAKRIVAVFKDVASVAGSISARAIIIKTNYEKLRDLVKDLKHNKNKEMDTKTEIDEAQAVESHAEEKTDSTGVTDASKNDSDTEKVNSNTEVDAKSVQTVDSPEEEAKTESSSLEEDDAEDYEGNPAAAPDASQDEGDTEETIDDTHNKVQTWWEVLQNIIYEN